MSRHNACHNGGKSSCRTGYINVTAAKECDDKAGNNRSVQTLLGRYAGRDSQCNGQRQRNDGYDDTRNDVIDQFGYAVLLSKRKQLRLKCFHKNDLSPINSQLILYNGSGVVFNM